MKYFCAMRVAQLVIKKIEKYKKKIKEKKMKKEERRQPVVRWLGGSMGRRWLGGFYLFDGCPLNSWGALFNWRRGPASFLSRA